MTLFVRSILLFSCFLMVSAPAAAQNEPPVSDVLEQLMGTEVTTVTGASKYQQELVDAPASVSIITADDIRKGGYRNLAEALNSVRSFYTTYIRSFHNIGVRGFSPLGDFNTRVLMLVDGYRLNDGLYEQAPLGSDFPVDMDLIDRIEVIRGPGSSLYGTNAFLAVINVITRNGKDIKGGELSASGGSYNSWTGRVTGGDSTSNNIDLLFSGSYRDSAGQQSLSYPEYSASSFGVARNMDSQSTYDLMAKAAWKNLSMQVLYQNRDKTVPTAPYGTLFNDPSEKIKEDHLLVGLNYNSIGGWADLNARLTYNRYAPKSDYPYDFNGVYTLNRDNQVGEWVDADVFASKAFGDHLLTLGTEFRWQFNQHLHNYDVFPYLAGPDLKKDSLVQGYYLQDEYHILKQLILTAGVRVDHYENSGTTTNPKAALVWKPRSSTVVRLTYGEAFRAPNSYEQYYGDGITQKGNPNLNPEKNRTAEVGVDQFIGENIRATFSGFYTEISDLLVQVTDIDGLLVFVNQNKVQSRGVELGADGKWENGFSGRLSYSYQDSRYFGVSKAVPNSPHTLVKAALTAPLPLPKSFATMEMLYNSSTINAYDNKIGGAAIFNLTLLNRDLLKGLDLSASIYNLFDKQYAAPSGPEHFNSLGENLREIRQDRITFRIKATYRF